MARVKRSVMEANALHLLSYLDAHASGEPRVAIVSLRSMMTDLRMTQARVRRLVHLLDERGYIKVERCFADDGGGRPNAHLITTAGAVMLESYRAAGRDLGGAGSSVAASECVDELLSKQYA